MEYTVKQLKEIIEEAKIAAHEASLRYFNERLDGEDQYSCGFAWVNIYGIKGNTKMGKCMRAAGLEKDYQGAYQLWNPGGLSVQNVDTKEAGAKAAAEILKKYGFIAYAADEKFSEDIKVNNLTDEELRETIQLLIDRLGFKIKRHTTPDYTFISITEQGNK